MGSSDVVRRSWLSQMLRRESISVPAYREIVSALALRLEAQGEALALSSELLRREGRHWGEISYVRKEPMASLLESCLAFRDWVALRIGDEPAAQDAKSWVDQVIVSAVEAYSLAVMEAKHTVVMLRDSTPEQRSAPAPLSNLDESTASDFAQRRTDRNSDTTYSKLSALESRILREVERYGQMSLDTASDLGASSALQSLVRKGLVLPSVGAGIGLQLTEMGRFVANLGQRT